VKHHLNEGCNHQILGSAVEGTVWSVILVRSVSVKGRNLKSKATLELFWEAEAVSIKCNARSIFQSRRNAFGIYGVRAVSIKG
jgi:hypothetical protein